MRIKLISLPSLVTASVVLSVLFVTVGDRLFPEPLQQASRDSRTWLQNSLVSLFPDIKVENGYDNKNNDRIIRQVEKEVK